MPRKANKTFKPVNYQVIPGDVWRLIFNYLEGRDLENLAKCLKVKIPTNSQIVTKLQLAKLSKIHDISYAIMGMEKDKLQAMEEWSKKYFNYYFVFFDFFNNLDKFLRVRGAGLNINYPRLLKLVKPDDELLIYIDRKRFYFSLSFQKVENSPLKGRNHFLCIKQTHTLKILENL